MLGREEIARRIPHAGAMCLLDRVDGWDDVSIRCAATSHRDLAHPLREAAGLEAWAGIEYAAQAAAVHGSLVAGDGLPRQAVLGRLRDVVSGCARLDEIACELALEARLLHRDPAGAVYAFDVRGAGRSLLAGQFTLMYRPA
jgi:predicted hotdog family 3-hydroxylacyl-ACP dehydratase